VSGYPLAPDLADAFCSDFFRIIQSKLIIIRFQTIHLLSGAPYNNRIHFVQRLCYTRTADPPLSILSIIRARSLVALSDFPATLSTGTILNARLDQPLLVRTPYTLLNLFSSLRVGKQ